MQDEKVVAVALICAKRASLHGDDAGVIAAQPWWSRQRETGGGRGEGSYKKISDHAKPNRATTANILAPVVVAVMKAYVECLKKKGRDEDLRRVFAG